MKRREIKLNEQEVENLKALTKTGLINIREYKRARTLLLLHQGVSDQDVLKQADVSFTTLKRIRKGYLEEGISKIKDKPKSGRPSIFTGEQRAKITALACSEPPKGHARWTLRLLADKAVELDYVKKISHETVGVILKKTNSTLT